MPLGKALRVVVRDMIKQPRAIAIPFGMVMGVYTLTYGASNLVDVVSERYELGAATQNTLKLCGATGAYTTSSIFKDVAFAKMFSQASAKAAEVKRTVPMTTYGTFLFRDSLIIGAGFILPSLVAGGLKSNTDFDAQTAEKIAQLATPCAMQLVITPIHLLGLNLYNVPSVSAAERFRAVSSTYPEATGVRMLRFLWAYGVGGLVNKDLTQRARDWTVHYYAVDGKMQRKKSFIDGSLPADGMGLKELQGALQKSKTSALM